MYDNVKDPFGNFVSVAFLPTLIIVDLKELWTWLGVLNFHCPICLIPLEDMGLPCYPVANESKYPLRTAAMVQSDMISINPKKALKEHGFKSDVSAFVSLVTDDSATLVDPFLNAANCMLHNREDASSLVGHFCGW